jgi:plastocyanin
MNRVYKKVGVLLSFGLLTVGLAEAYTPAATANLENAMAQLKPRIPAAKNQILMGGSTSGLYVYEPKQLVIKAGDTVTFALAGVGPHNVVFDKVPGDDKALMEKLSRPKLLVERGKSTTVSFEGAPKGVYSFHCAPHLRAGMRGTITVQ